MKITAAVATNDGKTTIKKHFGDADYYYIYEVSAEQFHLLKKIDNSSDVEEERHADPRKAKSVAAVLSSENVNTAVAKVFGPNLKRIKSKFVCVIVNDEQIEDAVKKVQQRCQDIEAEWNKGLERSYLKFE